MVAPLPARSLTVLVVEDDDGLRLLMRQVLESAGYQVCEADEGFQALSVLLQGRPVDLVVTDIRMPRMDGYELAAHMLGAGHQNSDSVRERLCERAGCHGASRADSTQAV